MDGLEALGELALSLSELLEIHSIGKGNHMSDYEPSLFEYRDRFNARHSVQEISDHQHRGHALYTKWNDAFEVAEKHFLASSGYITDNQAGVDFQQSINKHSAELKKHATFTPKGWVMNDGVDKDVFNTALKNLQDADTARHKFCSGETTHRMYDVEHTASPELQKAYKEAMDATQEVSKVMNGWLGKLQVEGWRGALKHNLNFMDAAVMENRGKVVFGRVAGVGAGVAMVADAMFRSKSGDNEARGILTRIAEGVTGLALAGGSALAGAAR